MSRSILVLDPGSSSLKFGLFTLEQPSDDAERAFERSPDPACLATGEIDRLGYPDVSLSLEVRGRQPRSEKIRTGTIAECWGIVLHALREAFGSDSERLAGIGCRVVQGGDRFGSPTRVTAGVIEAIRALAPIAPLHNPASADLLEACSSQLPNVPLFAVFDTSFHRTMPDVARTYALPFALCEQYGLHKFGFHGIAHQYVSRSLLEKIGRIGGESRCITCHLGNGASICAISNGRSIDTSMGMTPLEGLVMGTRSGDVDPGLLLYLMRTQDMSAEEIEDLLNHRSGLLGVSGASSDLRDLEPAATNGDARAKLALELFAYRAAKTIGGYTAALEGLDALAFSGGIGEHSASMRTRICRRLACIGINLDERLNSKVETGKPSCISVTASPVQIWVIPADENLQIAREVLSELAAAAQGV